MIEMNVNSTVWMTQLVIDGMAERKRGTIVNLSSGSADHTMPLLAEYGAAKMFVARFSESLDAEYRGRGVRVQCQIPFYVATKLAKLRKSLTVPTAEAYVWMSMRWIGHGGVVQPVSAALMLGVQDIVLIVCVIPHSHGNYWTTAWERIRKNAIYPDISTGSTASRDG